MKQKESIFDTMKKFSEKISRFEKAETKSFQTSDSQNKNLEKKLHLSEEERIEKIKNKYETYKNPLSKEIEDDESILLSAYNYFLEHKKLNQKYANHNIKFKKEYIDCPLTKKENYIYKNDFIFLKLWFYLESKNSDYIPELIQDENKNFFITFRESENYKFSLEEKNILQIISI